MTHPRPAISTLGLINLLVVYVVWSSTYLAIRVAVREGSGFPPFMVAGLRLFFAGIILLTVAALMRNRLRPSRDELRVLTISGLALWIGGNGGVTWAEQHAHSGYAALLIASSPIWVAVMEALVNRQAPSGRLVVALLVGLSGVALLTGPVLAGGITTDVAATVALLISAISWGAGSLYQKRQDLHLGIAATAGYQSLIGGSALLLIARLTGEPTPAPTTEAWIAWSYLLVFSSLVAFPAFVQVLRLLPLTVGMTYAYVTPVGAVLLGWIFLGESITPFTLAGAALVLLGVAGVFREQLRSQAPVIEEPAVPT